MHRLIFYRLLNEHNVFAINAIGGIGDRIVMVRKMLQRGFTSCN